MTCSLAAPVDPVEEGAHLGVGTMKSSVNLEVLFPIKDAPSASFMSFRADCLLDAGIITERDKQWVEARVLSCLRAMITHSLQTCARRHSTAMCRKISVSPA